MTHKPAARRGPKVVARSTNPRTETTRQAKSVTTLRDGAEETTLRPANKFAVVQADAPHAAQAVGFHPRWRPFQPPSRPQNLFRGSLAGIELDPRAATIAELRLPNGQWMVDSPERLRCKWVRGIAPGADFNDRCESMNSVSIVSNGQTIDHSHIVRAVAGPSEDVPGRSATRPDAVWRRTAGDRDRSDFRAR